MLVRIALLLVALPLLAHGAAGLSHAFRSRTQAHVTCAEFDQARPASGWLQLTGCEIDYVRAGYRERRGRVTELFFPLRPAGSSPAQPSVLVLSTCDPALLSVIETGLRGPARHEQEAFLVMMLQIVTAMRASRKIEGDTRSPLEMLRTRTDLRALKAPLAEDFTVLDLHQRPRLLFPAIEAVVGAQALFVFAVLWAGRRRVGKTPPPAAAATVSGDVATAAARARTADARFRRLMLVNLPPHAPLSALEDAPPLGQPPAVRSALARVLPGVTFTEAGAGHFVRPDHEVRLDFGTTPPVWTATVDVTGEGAAAALRRLVTQTGWQVYAPALGRFLTSDDLNT